MFKYFKKTWVVVKIRDVAENSNFFSFMFKNKELWVLHEWVIFWTKSLFTFMYKKYKLKFSFKSYFRKWMKDQISCQGSLKGLYQYKSVSNRLIYSLKACESSWRCNNSFFISVNFILPTMILWNVNLTFFNWLQTHSDTMKRIIFFKQLCSFATF